MPRGLKEPGAISYLQDKALPSWLRAKKIFLWITYNLEFHFLLPSLY